MFVHFLQRFQDLVGQNAVGHFIGGDLLQQGLVLAIGRAGVELAAQLFDLVLAALEQQLLLVGRHACRLRLPARGARFLVQPGDVGFPRLNLFGPARDALAKVG
jgi:hypothetical protein